MSTLELPIGGMNHTACTKKLQGALRKLPGVDDVEILLSAEKAVIVRSSERVQIA
ncbi:heavy-metal-associated domain-containing protein [Bosea beijingensis]|uniref:heavy-metal-associated domain-containing protein n=1 Tax=Bosea beijingensis TaxID=3068632 RepID=UPI0027418B30|nr:heavy metal-associated domain-containing protein [Bosea sp. REN20]